ncbi:MAG: hypothetical protein IKC10_05780 [Alphaproteobacteria bacterium]|nr:hypothetical protein [Alphaproteobacteria bacterium]
MLNQLYIKLNLLVDKVNSVSFLQSFFDNRFYLILLVIILVHLKNATYKSMFLCALINMPGTILHETMHFIVGLLLNAKPCNFTLFPRRNENGYVMGSVGFTNITFYNAIPASMAPLMLLPIGFYLNRYFLPNMAPTFTNYVLYVLLQTIIIENALPSSADFKVARMYFLGILMYTAIGVGLFLML